MDHVKRLPSQDGDAVVGFLPDHLRGVAQTVKRQRWKARGLAFDFLQEQDVGLACFQPALHVGFALADRIDVPGGDLHEGSLHWPGGCLAPNRACGHCAA